MGYDAYADKDGVIEIVVRTDVNPSACGPVNQRTETLYMDLLEPNEGVYIEMLKGEER